MGLKCKPPEGDVRRVVSIEQNLRGVITNKVGCTVQFESFAERTLLLLFERDQTILNYRSQPETFEFIDQNQKSRRYTPDFKVWRTDGSIEIHEVTLTERQEQFHIHEREIAAQQICRERCWNYIIHTEKTLLQKAEVANLLALLRYRLKIYEHNAIAAAIRELLQEHGPVRLQKCVKCIVQCLKVAEPTVFATVCHLLWYEELCTDFQTLLIVDSVFVSTAMIWLPFQKEERL